MAESTEADRYLLKQIAAGDEGGWSQLVARYHGRLLAFARRQLKRPGDAEDLVQEAFIAFLTHRTRFDPTRSVETFLFTTLRRRIIDTYRGRAAKMCLLGDAGVAEETAGGQGASSDPSASWYVRRDEQAEKQRDALAKAMESLLRRYKQAERFRDIQILELLFYAQLRNQEVAKTVGVEERAVAVLKHRWLHELAEHIAEQGGSASVAAEQESSVGWDPALMSDSLLTEVWEQERLTCPKRTTIGRHLLGTLDDDAWRQYVAFHLDTLGCKFCGANADDLREATKDDAKTPSSDRLFQSTIGFFRGP
jgi:RNA polymerase sigma factor (sigma-70 family)